MSRCRLRSHTANRADDRLITLGIKGISRHLHLIRSHCEVALRGNDFLSRQNFLTHRAVGTLGQAGLGTSGCFGGKNRFHMSRANRHPGQRTTVLRPFARCPGSIVQGIVDCCRNTVKGIVRKRTGCLAQEGNRRQRRTAGKNIVGHRRHTGANRSCLKHCTAAENTVGQVCDPISDQHRFDLGTNAVPGPVTGRIGRNRSGTQNDQCVGTVKCPS